MEICYGGLLFAFYSQSFHSAGFGRQSDERNELYRKTRVSRAKVYIALVLSSP